MVSTRSMNTRSTRSRTYITIAPIAIVKCTKVTKKEVKSEPVSTRKSTRVSNPVKDTFNTDLYGRDSNGERNQYHGWSGDRWQREFNGRESSSLEEFSEEFVEDKLIAQELKKYKIGHAGYALDDFIINEEYEDEYESDEESISSEDSEDEDADYWYEYSDDEE